VVREIPIGKSHQHLHDAEADDKNVAAHHPCARAVVLERRKSCARRFLRTPRPLPNGSVCTAQKPGHARIMRRRRSAHTSPTPPRRAASPPSSSPAAVQPCNGGLAATSPFARSVARKKNDARRSRIQGTRARVDAKIGFGIL
jgi:hypothetical protein